MINTLSQSWWLIALRGLVAVLFGVAAIAWPGLTLATLVLLYGVYGLADGIFAIFTALQDRKVLKRWWLSLLQGLVSIGIGILTFVWPVMTALAMVYIIAAWAIITGVVEIVAAIQLRKEIEGEWLLVVSGVLSAIFGLFLPISPASGA